MRFWRPEPWISPPRFPVRSGRSRRRAGGARVRAAPGPDVCPSPRCARCDPPGRATGVEENTAERVRRRPGVCAGGLTCATAAQPRPERSCCVASTRNCRRSSRANGRERLRTTRIKGLNSSLPFKAARSVYRWPGAAPNSRLRGQRRQFRGNRPNQSHGGDRQDDERRCIPQRPHHRLPPIPKNASRNP